MKKNIFSLMLLLATTLCFTSCDDDDDDDIATVNIEGTYLGKLESMVCVMGAEVPVSQDDVVTIITKEADSYTVTIKDYTYNGDNYGDIVVTNVLMDDNDSFSGNGECTLTKNDRDYTATIEELEGDKEGNEIDINFNMNLPVSPMMTIVFDITYTGKEN